MSVDHEKILTSEKPARLRGFSAFRWGVAGRAAVRGFLYRVAGAFHELAEGLGAFELFHVVGAEVFSKVTQGGKLKVLTGTEAGKKYVLHILSKYSERVGHKLGFSEGELMRYSGKEFVDAVMAEVRKLDPHIRGKVEHYIRRHVRIAQILKDGSVADLHAGVVVDPAGNVSEVNVAKEDEIAKLKAKGLKLSDDWYFDVMVGRAVDEAVAKASTPGKARELFEKYVRELLREDDRFKRALIARAEKHQRFMAKYGTLTRAVYESMAALPKLMVAAVARVMSRVATLIPLFGPVAAVHVELGTAVADAGEQVANRIRAVAYQIHRSGGKTKLLAEQPKHK